MARIDEALALLAKRDLLGAASGSASSGVMRLDDGYRSSEREAHLLTDRTSGDPVAPWLAGRRFEHLVREALLAHPAEWGTERFDEVWLWNDWPGAWGADVGIDLVARQTEQWGGGLIAVQCKYRPSGAIPTEEIDSFLAASGTGDFAGRLLVTNGPGIQSAGRAKIERAEPRCQVLHAGDMDDWVPDWTEFVDRRLAPGSIRFERHDLRPYQHDALRAIREGFESADRGKLILPCGTGKSFIALRAAEEAVGSGGSVLYFVPSIALMGQTMREWSRQRDPFSSRHSYLAVCSDATVGKQETLGNPSLVGDMSELAMPVTTDAASLRDALGAPLPPGTMRVVYSTYHSTPVVAEALAAPDLLVRGVDGRFRFDLIVADEAHRTTGLSEASASAAEMRRLAKSRYQGISPFNLVHHDDHLPSRRRLYMTATPRVFTAKQRRDLDEGGKYDDADSYSMDDPRIYGDEFHRMSFAEAIDGGWLSDYQVLVIARSTGDYEAAAGAGGVFLDGEAVDTESVVKLGGCWDALATPQSEGPLSKRRTGEVRAEWGVPARSAIAFCGSIKTSKKVASAWKRVVEWHCSRNDSGRFLGVDVDHLDANTPAVKRASLIGGLRRHAEADQPVGNEGGAGVDSPAPICRVLTNVRVLSEGVDVPALDAVLFLESRSSPIDVTQAVGRVMRRAAGKEQGYIVIPVVVDEFGEGTPEERARRLLREGNFKPVYEVVRALRAHDERIDYWLNAKRSDRVKLLSDRIRDDRTEDEAGERQLPLQFEFGDLFASMLLDQCGDRNLYATWGKRAAQVCQQVDQRVKRLVAEHEEIGEAFDRFHGDLQRLIGEQQVTAEAAAEMVAQHVVTIPIFDHVVTAAGFASRNPLARALGSLLDVLREHGHAFEDELRPLTRAYRSMERAFEGAASGADRLNVLKEIYESFFKEAMPSAVKSLGIVYTPVEIVDFMLRSVDAVCREQFGKGLSAPGVHVLDPFTGTGTFFNRLLTAKDANGEYLVRFADLDRKYGRTEGGEQAERGEMHAAMRVPGELHANEIVLLAYYIAALKVEEARHERKVEQAGWDAEDVGEAGGEGHGRSAPSVTGGSVQRQYEPFGGMVLTDTFLMSEKQAELRFNWAGLDEAGQRIREQNSRRIRVIVGNPPWSAGRKAAGDESVAAEYPEVARRVNETYVRELRALGSSAAAKATGNLFVKAFRWASDRLDGEDGIVCFVHPNSLADAPSLAGMRKALRDEFTDIYVVNLRGNAYKSGAERRHEGNTVFGQGTRNGVQITLLARNRERRREDGAELHYAEVPDGCSLDRKFAWLDDLGSVLATDGFRRIPANDRHDWVNVGDPTWNRLMPVCSSSAAGSDSGSVARVDALGLATNLDAYVYSYSYIDLCDRVEALIAEFNRTLDDWVAAGRPARKSAEFERITDSNALHAIKWTERLKATLAKGEPLDFDPRRIREVLYRPFTKLWLYEDYRILSAGRKVSEMFPRSAPPPGRCDAILLTCPSNKAVFGVLGTSSLNDSLRSGDSAGLSGPPENSAILITAPSNRTVFALLATDRLADLHPLDPATRILPLHLPGG